MYGKSSPVPVQTHLAMQACSVQVPGLEKLEVRVIDYDYTWWYNIALILTWMRSSPKSRMNTSPELRYLRLSFTSSIITLSYCVTYHTDNQCRPYLASSPVPFLPLFSMQHGNGPGDDARQDYIIYISGCKWYAEASLPSSLWSVEVVVRISPVQRVWNHSQLWGQEC